MNDMKFTTAKDYMADEDNSYDVVIDVLQKHYDKLNELTQRNMKSEYLGLNIMDDIRLRQMDELKEAMKMWSERNK